MEMNYTFRLLPLSILLFFSSLTMAQYDTLRVMYYNVLDFPNSLAGREVYFRVVNQYVQADIILVSELKTSAGANLLLNDALNVYGTTHYQKAIYTQQDFSENLLYYNSDKLALYSQDVISTSIRDIDEYVLYYKSSDLATTNDTVFFYFYEAHLKANQGEEAQRLVEVNTFLNHLNAIPNAKNVFFGGDFNLYTSAEPAYQALINNTPYHFNDPLTAGDWHNSGTYSLIHTQSTRLVDIGDGGSWGGMDDRFDLTLFTNEVLSGTYGVQYIPNSCLAFGNDGAHFNKALIDLPANPNLPDSVIQALYHMSDHLPVISDYRVEATPPVQSQNIVITEIMYNPPEAGLDTLEFIEIYNQGNEIQNLQGFQFFGVDFTFPAVNINPGEFLVTCSNAQAMMNTFGVNALQWASDGLANNGELILLKDNFGVIVDSVFYSDVAPWPVEPDGNGPSLKLCDFTSDNGLGANWSVSENFVTNNASGNPIYASPGFSECVLPPSANFSVSSSFINIGESVQFTDLSLNNPTTWSWTFEGGNPASSSLQNPNITYDTPGTFNVQLVVSNSAGSDTKLLSGFISVGSNDPVLIITEIMQNPGIVNDADGEWFELYNPTAFPIDLLGWTIRDNDFDTHTISSSVIVGAFGFATLGINNTALNGGYTCDYQYSNFLLANAADEVILLAPDNSEIDRVEYDGGPNWPDPTGSSMVFTGSAVDDNNNPNFWATANLHEPSYTGTSGDDGSPGSNGNQQNLNGPILLQLKLFLHGPFNGASMSTDLNPFIPLLQPFNTSPWNYNGPENISTISSNMVDWVLLELRNASTAATATLGTIVERKAAILLSDGSVVDVGSNSPIQWTASVAQNLFVVVNHRNHLSVLSGVALNRVAGVYSYDFSTSLDKAFNNGQTEISSGIFGMISGDSDASGLIDGNDKSVNWENESANQGYFSADLNLDSQVNNLDKNDFWLPQQGQSSQVPE